jgi:hypothetical protein
MPNSLNMPCARRSCARASTARRSLRSLWVPKTLSPPCGLGIHDLDRRAVAAQRMVVWYLLWVPAAAIMGARRQGLVTSGPPGELWLLLGEMTLVAPAVGPSPIERRLARAGRDVRAVTVLLEQARVLLRQLVCVTGWLVVLAATARLLIQPHFGPGHLAAPAAGALAVLQGISPRRAGCRQRAAQPPRGLPATHRRPARPGTLGPLGSSPPSLWRCGVASAQHADTLPRVPSGHTTRHPSPWDCRRRRPAASQAL